MRRIFRVLTVTALFASVALSAALYAPGGVDARRWQPPPAPDVGGSWQPNERLHAAVREQAGLDGPDTVLPGPDGYRYTAVGGGRIVRWHAGAAVEPFATVDGRPVGLNFGADGALYGADELTGVLWKIEPDGTARRLADRYGARRLNLLNDVWPAADGSVYFTESTARWPLHENPRAMLEHGGDGSVFVWRRDGRVERVMEGLQFANGVVLPLEEDYLLVAETGAYRIARLYLRGERAGQRDVLIDNLPGFPGDLSRAPDGSYWCSLLSSRNPLLDHLGPQPWARRLLGRLPLSWLPSAQPYPFVFRFDAEGVVVETLRASPGSGLPSFSSVVQDGDDLLLGTAGGVGAIDSDGAYRLDLRPNDRR